MAPLGVATEHWPRGGDIFRLVKKGGITASGIANKVSLNRRKGIMGYPSVDITVRSPATSSRPRGIRREARRRAGVFPRSRSTGWQGFPFRGTTCQPREKGTTNSRCAPNWGREPSRGGLINPFTKPPKHPRGVVSQQQTNRRRRGDCDTLP